MGSANEKTLLSFLSSLERLSPLLKAVAGDDFQVVLDIRPGGERVLIDLTAEPVKVIRGAAMGERVAGMAGSLDDLHRAFSGRLNIMRGVGERRLLLRGGMSNLVRMFPVLELLPALYGEHLYAHQRAAGSSVPGARQAWRLVQLGLGGIATRLGARLSGLERRELLAALTCLARGLAEMSPLAQVPQDAPSVDPLVAVEDHPLAPKAPDPGRLKRLRLLHKAMGGLGRAVGLARYRLGLPLDLFSVMEDLARGMESGSQTGTS